jgi:hypothetical protein
MEVRQRVKLIRFNGKISPVRPVNKQEDYWKLIGETGIVCQDPEQKSIYANFSKKPRILVKFDTDITGYGLAAHNNINNSLWILVDDLEIQAI